MFVSYNLDFFGRELQKIRKSLGLTQADVQKMAGICIDTIRKVESGRVIPRYDTLELLSVAYRQDLLELLKKSRVNKLLLEFHDDLDYLISCYDKKISNSLRARLRENYAGGVQSSMVNPNELKQFLIFVDATDAYFSDFTLDRDKTKNDLISALKLTIPGYDFRDYRRYTYSYIEFRILLFISLFIAKEGEYSFSNKILFFILHTIKAGKHYTKYIDFLTAHIHFNIAYNFHMLDKHAKVIEAADSGIDHCIKSRTFIALFSLYYRKGIAQYHLKDEGYRDTLAIAFYTLKAVRIPKLLNQYQEITEKKYGITVPLIK
jgi:transcriptional regulator with XRE-family HTH domain